MERRDREYGWNARVGLLVAPGSTTVEPEFASFLPPGNATYAARMPGQVGQLTHVGLRERILGYNERLAEVAATLIPISPDIVCLPETGCSYVAGYESEQSLHEALLASRSDKVTTAASAVAFTFRALEAKRIGLVSPYPAWLSELALSYWAAAGYPSIELEAIEDVGSIYDVTAGQVLDACRRLQQTMMPDVLFVTGTGVPTIRAVHLASVEFEVPVLSSNLCLGYQILDMTDQLSDTGSPRLVLADMVSRGLLALRQPISEDR